MPNWLSSFFSQKNIISGLKGVNGVVGNGTSRLPTGLGGQEITDNMSEAERLNAQIGNGVQTAFTSLLDFNTIAGSGMNGAQKTMARADSTVDGLSSLASNIPGIGGVIGGAVGTINKIGGALIGTPKELKNYVGNEAALSSSGYSGVANQGKETAASINSYKGSGLAGKLFGGKKVKNAVGQANYMQSQVQGILDVNNNVKARAAGSTDLFANSNLSKINGLDSSWSNGSVQYGQEGMKINKQPPVSPDASYTNAQKLYDPLYTKLTKAYGTDDYDELLKDKRIHPSVRGVLDSAFGYSPNDFDNGKRVVPPLSNNMKDLQKQLLSMSDNDLRNLLSQDYSKVDAFNFKSRLPKGVGYFDAFKYYKEFKDLTKKGYTFQRGGKMDYKKIVRDTKSKLDKKDLKKEPKETQVKIHKEGGAINVIVDGELHARKHDLKSLEHLEDAEITHKGVPVIALSEGGEVTQCAEVEKDELIIHYKLTKQMEKLAEKGDEEAMIEAGRILAIELVKNTKDSKSKILKNA